jgi:hypothetical protein
VITTTIIMSGPNLDLSELQPSASRPKRASRKGHLPNWPQSASRRLERQIKRISDSYQGLAKEPERKISFCIDSKHQELQLLLENLRAGVFSYRQVGDGLLLVAYKATHSRQTIYSKLSDSKDNNRDYHEKLAGVEQRVLDICDKSRNDNSIMTAPFFYDHAGKSQYMLGMTHFFWWPVDVRVIEQVIFQDVLVLTIYNPAHLMRKFEENGFKTEITDGGNYRIWKSDGERTLELEGISYFFAAVQSYFFSEESIVRIFKQVEEEARVLDSKHPMRIDLMVMQMV